MSVLRGRGHPRFINLPKLDFPPEVESYPPAEKSGFSLSGIGKKEFEILLVPKREGILKIPPFKFSYFDPHKGQYFFYESPAFAIPVRKSSQAALSQGQNFFESAKKTESDEGRTPRALERGLWPDFINHANLLYFWRGLFLFLVLALGFLYIQFLYLKKEKSLQKQFQPKFLAIRKLLDKKDWRTACAQTIQIGYLALYKKSSDKSSMSANWREALQNLPPSLGEKYFVRFKKLFQELENLSFSKVSLTRTRALEQSEALFQEMKELIKEFISNKTNT